MGTSSNLHRYSNSAHRLSGENPELDFYTIPISASWFKWEEIHDKEKEALKEFFDGTSITRTPKIYKEYRDFIINKFREDSSKRLTFSEARKHLVGDISLLLKVFDFLEDNGLINFNHSAPQIEREHKEDDVRFECSSPNGVKITGIDGPSISRPNPIPLRKPLPSPLASYSYSFNPAPSPRQEYSNICGEEDSGQKNDTWSEEETLLLLESVLQHGDDWDLVVNSVPNKSKTDCITKILELPFGDLIVAPSTAKDGAFPVATDTLTSEEVEKRPPSKKPRSGFDSSLIEQVISISSAVENNITSAAAIAAIGSICDEISCSRDAIEEEEILGYPDRPLLPQEPETDQNSTLQDEEDAVPFRLRLRSAAATSLGAAAARARVLAGNKSCEMEKTLGTVLDTQVKKMRMKLKDLEEMECLMEKEYEELDHLNKCFIQQRILLLHRSVSLSSSKFRS